MGMPFKVRDAQQINTDLGFLALPNDFTALPITVFSNYDVHDDTGASGCHYVDDVAHKLKHDPATWTIFDPQREEITPAIEASLGLTDEYVRSLDFGGFKDLTDTDIARDFQHTFDHADFFTDEQWEIDYEF